MVILGPLCTVLQFLLSLYLLQKKKKRLRNNVATSFARAVVLVRGGTRVGKRVIIVDYSIILKLLTIMIMYLFKKLNKCYFLLC